MPLFLWPVALVHVLMTPGNVAKAEARKIEKNESRRCPFCAELIRPEAIVCRFCSRDLPERPTSAPAQPALPPDPVTQLSQTFTGDNSDVSGLQRMVAELRAAGDGVDVQKHSLTVRVGQSQRAFHSNGYSKIPIRHFYLGLNKPPDAQTGHEG